MWGNSSFIISFNKALAKLVQTCLTSESARKLDKRVEKPDKAMNDEVLGKRLWDELDLLTGLTPK